MMKRSVASVLPAVLSLIFVSCPLASDYTLSDPLAAKVDPMLIGEWKIVDESSGTLKTFSFLAFDDREYVALIPGDADGEIDAYRAFVTEIDGVRFLNVRELTVKNDEPWYFLQYRVEKSRLELRLIDDALFTPRTFASSNELNAFVRERLADPLLYGKEGGKTPDFALKRP